MKTTQQTIHNRTIILETGEIAKQAGGSVILRCGDLVLLAAATMSKEPKPGIDFFPLTIEFSEKMYASGKFPGGFFKRETRPSNNATLTARLIDRPIRPCFADNFRNDVQVVITVLSYDPTIAPDYLSIIAASAALSVSNIPFLGPVGAARVGQIDGRLVLAPTEEQMAVSTLDLIVAGTKDAILMIEAGASEVSEQVIMEAIQLAHGAIKESVALQEQLVAQVNPIKAEVPALVLDAGLTKKIKDFMGTSIADNLQAGNKDQTDAFLNQLSKDVLAQFVTVEPDNTKDIKQIFSLLKKEQIRATIIQKKKRPDGRGLDEIRPISGRTGLLPSAHGSSLFTRGETQSLGVVTLGSADDEQIEDGLTETRRQAYYFHYNFPPYSVGEVGMMRTSRRELGHGALAQRALEAVIPSHEDFPYTVRIVSEILESNGSSSMASVCSGTLALMDCGVPIKAPVSGIAMGLLIDGNDYVVLSDIQGLEDHYGDMDFKVAGTARGITALQLDIKVGGLSQDILSNALAQAKQGRAHILNEVLKILDKPRHEVSQKAPKIDFFTIDPEKVGLVIGPGGKMIRKIEEESGATVIIMEGNEGKINVAGPNAESVEKAKAIILGLTKEVEEGDVYDGKVVRITAFGAFVELLPGKDGLIHISKLSKERVERVEDVLSTGDIIKVKVIGIDAQNRVSLALQQQDA